eukprot:gnl/Hemi2/18977_TR6279_c0_g3_i1.p1 gnl/Hemi2/18977_TR6279_c0_g3~~gnl/Hemi2/18977_TR6279_c0_g3_i1.p1  ORF type:complete len:147 (-),score=34.33 gnl/Hemi2/18977_TR6279_c0_g3_i1:5-415(-)
MSDDEQQAAGGKAEDVEEEEEERPAQKRKPAAGKSKAPPAKKSKSEDDDAEGEGFSIGGMRRISVQQFRNKPLVSIREFYEKDGKLMPGKKRYFAVSRAMAAGQGPRRTSRRTDRCLEVKKNHEVKKKKKKKKTLR